MAGEGLSTSQDEGSGQLADLLKSARPDQLKRLVMLLRGSEEALTRGELGYRLGTSPSISALIFRTLNDWTGHPHGRRLLADAIEVALSVARSTTSTSSELVWTGPDEGAPTARRTVSVVSEMLKTASSHILIVGYSLFLGAEPTRAIIRRLGELASSGVRVEFIVDGQYAGWDGVDEEGFSVRQIQRFWPEACPLPKVWSWRSSDDVSKLHAKVLIVDRRDLLVTSANLTGAGLALNLEVGIRTSGSTAAACSDHFTRLINLGLFNDEPWD